MVRLYVTHSEEWSPERRPILEQNLKSRGFTDVVWVTSYPATHPFVKWLYVRTGKHLNTSRISGLVKHLEAMRMFTEDPAFGPQDGAMFCDNDALFIKDWQKGIDKIPKGFPYVNLSVGVNFHFLPDGQPREIMENNGGSEAYWLTKDFAKFALQHVDARMGGDHVFCGMMKLLGYPVMCIPIAQQTSIITDNRSAKIEEETIPFDDWKHFVHNFKPTGLSYEALRNESGLAREDA